MSVFFDTASNFHPYECDGASGGCIHCLRADNERHDPGVCALCDPDYDMAPNAYWKRPARRRASSPQSEEAR